MDAVGCKENIEQRLKVYQGLSEILPGSAQSLEESGDVPQSSYAKGKPTSCQIGQAKVTSITPMSEILARSTKAIASPCCGCHVKIPAVWGHLLPELSSSKHCCPRPLDYQRICYRGVELISQPMRDTDIEQLGSILNAINSASENELITESSAGFHVHVSAGLIPNSTEIRMDFTAGSLVRLLVLYVLSTGNRIFLDSGPAFVESLALLCSRSHRLIQRGSPVPFPNVLDRQRPWLSYSAPAVQGVQDLCKQFGSFVEHLKEAEGIDAMLSARLEPAIIGLVAKVRELHAEHGEATIVPLELHVKSQSGLDQIPSWLRTVAVQHALAQDLLCC